MKKFDIYDVRTRVRFSDIPRRDLPGTLCALSGLFGSREEDIRILDVNTGIEITYKEFMAAKTK